MQPMWFDLAILGVLAFCTYRGATKGIVWQLAWIAALILCFAVSESASVRIAGLIPVDAPLNRWIAMFAIYLASVFVTFWIARKIGDWIEKHRFVEFDRHLGAVFGFLKGVLFSLILVFFIVTLSAEARDVVLRSKSGYAAAVVMGRLHAVMPEDLHEVLEPYIHGLDDAKSHPSPSSGGENKSGSARETGNAKSNLAGDNPLTGND